MADNTEKKILFGEGTGQIIEKKSRFIASCYEIHTEEEALKYIEEKRKQYWDARHNCFAYVLGGNNEIQRFSDDKEPQGTAGRPILEVLLNNHVHNCLIVVTRYFGGVLLGTGGLTRAYSSAASEGLKNSQVLKVCEGKRLTINTDYNSLGKILYIIGQLNENGICAATDTVYTDSVTLSVILESHLYDVFLSRVTEATSGQAAVDVKDSVSFAMKDGEPVILSA